MTLCLILLLLKIVGGRRKEVTKDGAMRRARIKLNRIKVDDGDECDLLLLRR